jgi:TolB-like protein
MKQKYLLAVVFSFILWGGQTFAQVEDIDKELATLAEKLAGPITSHGKKKVTVIDFTDLQGGSSELGKYIAEQLTVNLVMGNREFSVLDRANLKSILAEHKLTAKGLVDPDTAKKIGMFTGVDALILGTIVPKDKSISLTAKIITTDTAEIVGAARGEFKSDETVQKLLARPTTDAQNRGGSGGAGDDAPGLIKVFGDLRVEIQPLKVADNFQFQLSMDLENKNAKKSMWVCLKSERNQKLHATVTDSDGNEFISDPTKVAGMEVSYTDYYAPNMIPRATEIRPGESITASIRFYSQNRATAGTCRLHLEIISGNSFNGSMSSPSVRNVSGLIIAK